MALADRVRLSIVVDIDEENATPQLSFTDRARQRERRAAGLRYTKQSTISTLPKMSSRFSNNTQRLSLIKALYTAASQAYADPTQLFSSDSYELISRLSLSSICNRVYSTDSLESPTSPTTTTFPAIHLFFHRYPSMRLIGRQRPAL
ncbi:hypothetical protein D9613_008519 [Agrocybe pediades]|uniref:Uncharacterized protein n=1 Tax=Agrocybe pediades TaxID=84607 RepID=A0A8H4QUI7_9AGAR|nr:hypothetical protein D9613_008519 [Agrocybe pediades]